MKEKFKKVYFLVIGLIVFGTISVSAAILLQPEEVSFISDKTSQTTVKGALDELYELAKGDCPVGHICTTCGAGTYANQTTMECVTCPTGYTSDAGAGKEGDCYIQTTAGKYIANAGDTSQTNCPAGSYCPSAVVKYGSTGETIACPTGFTSDSGATSINQCYIMTTAGKWIANADDTTQTTCPEGSYCVSTKVYYGSTGGKTACPSIYTNSSSGATSASACYAKTSSGKYIASANDSSETSCNSGYYCPGGTTVYYGESGGIEKCPSDQPYSSTGSISENECYYTYNKYKFVNYGETTEGQWIATYACKNGTATITSCYYRGWAGTGTCDGGGNHVSPTYKCTSSGSENMADYCNYQKFGFNGVTGAGLPSSEACS